MALETLYPPKTVYRIGRKPDPWVPPSWAYAQADGTFGNRFDDPEGSYRVLYASTQRIACFAETLARFRPSLEVLAGLEEISGPNDFLLFNPADWAANRRIGRATVQGEFANVYANGWVSLLRRELAAIALDLGVHEIDLSSLQANQPRQLTQQVSLLVRQHGLAGIYYRSRFGHSLENWAIFEPWQMQAQKTAEISENDPEMLAILDLFAIRVASPTY